MSKDPDLPKSGTAIVFCTEKFDTTQKPPIPFMTLFAIAMPFVEKANYLLSKPFIQYQVLVPRCGPDPVRQEIWKLDEPGVNQSLTFERLLKYIAKSDAQHFCFELKFDEAHQYTPEAIKAMVTQHYSKT